MLSQFMCRGFDYLKFTGIALDGGMQTPSPWLKTFNRPFLLQNIIEQNIIADAAARNSKNTSATTPSNPNDAASKPTQEYLIHYDAVLMMDSVQIIANMDYDPFRLISSTSLDMQNYNAGGDASQNFNSSILLAWGNVVNTTTTTPTMNNPLFNIINSNNAKGPLEIRDFSSTNIKLSNVMVWNMNHPNLQKIAR